MLLRHSGYPEEDSFVLCTIKNIHYHSVFADLDEYPGRTGLIHISEISPGRIRNIRDYVVEGKKVVCKVLRIDERKGHIDLSLRRVNEMQRKNKLGEIKQEQKAEKIVEQVAKQHKKEVKTLYDELTSKIFPKYDDLTTCFKEVVSQPGLLEKLGIEKKISKDLAEIIAVRFKPEELSIGGILRLQSYEPDGVEIVKNALLDAEKTSDQVTISYAGGGMYTVTATALSYKEAEKLLSKAIETALAFTEKGKGMGEFTRKERE